MEKTKNGTVNKALMAGAATLISLNALAVAEAQAATGTGNISAIILTPVAITVPTDLHFGSMTESGAGGTMLIDTVGARTPGGAVTAVAGGGLESEAVLSITGATGINIDVDIVGAPITVNSGANTMTVSTFNVGTNAAGSSPTVTLTASPDTFGVGATLTVGAGQAPGTYTGTFQVTAAYQ